jgi:hypothetical protein
MNIKKIKKNIPIIIIVILVITNIYFIFFDKKETIIKEPEEIVFYQKCTNMNYKENKKYYKEINYKKFKSLYKKNDIYTVAIIDNTSNTYKSYLSLINHIAYYKSTNIFVLDISKLSKKNNIAFYELDDRLSKLEGNYIITTKKKKIISITEVEPSQIGSLIKEME